MKFEVLIYTSCRLWHDVLW